MIDDYFRLAVNSLFKRKLRSWLTMLGIFIGIAAVVSLISLSQGMQNAINEQFKKLGSDKITVQLAGNNYGSPGGALTTAKLTEDDSNVIRKVDGVDAVSGRLLKTSKVKLDRVTMYAAVAGLNVEPEDIKILEGTGFTEVVDGRMLKSSDTYKVVVGNNFETDDNRFGKEIRVGDVLEVNDIPFEVVGILKKTGIFFIDGAIVMRKDMLRDLYSINDKEESVIAVRVEPNADIDKVASEVERKLRKHRDVEEGKEDFQVATPQQLLNTFLTVFNIVTGVVIGIAAISLIVGGVGIMNTMYTAVLERTREIGIMKAIGARNSDVLLIFLIESGLLGMAGGIIGVVLGLSLGKIVELVALSYFGESIIEASFSLWLIFGALAFSFLVGSLSGILPAMQAAAMHPVQALKRR